MLKKSISKNSILKGKNYIFESGARVILQDGSSKNDIVLGDNVRLSGTIFSQNKGKVVIGNNTIIGSNSKIFCLESIRIGNYCAISTGITIVDNNNHPVNPEFRLFWRMNNGKFGTNLWIHSSFAPIIIEDNVWIGENARICKGVTIGKNAIVAACAVVTKNVPPNTIVAGNPAKVVKTDIDQIPPPNTNAHFNEYLKSKAK